MNLNDVEKIIQMFEKSNVNSIDLEIDNIKIKLEKNNPNSVISLPVDKVVATNVNTTSNNEETNDSKLYITSPLVGTFHEAPYQGGDPFVHVGDTVKKGQKLCIIEAMKVMNEINAPYDGVIKKILVKEGQMVEFGTNIYEVEASNV